MCSRSSRKTIMPDRIRLLIVPSGCPSFDAISLWLKSEKYASSIASRETLYSDFITQHPLSEALGALRREAEYERINLKGLDSREVGELLQTIADQDVPEALVKAIDAETEGNPFFIREVLLHLIEEGKVSRQDGRWRSNLAIEELGIPEGVRQVIGQRLSRLSAEANRVLAAASAFSGAFHFAITARVVGLEEGAALKAVDAALDAQLIRAGSEAESYDFTHALIRHTLYAEMNPSRQVRTHRQIAEEMEKFWGARVGEHAAEVAYQFSRSAALPGAERGAVHAIAAADYLAEANEAMRLAGFFRKAAALAAQGLRYAGNRRDSTWARLASQDLMREEAENPDYLGLPLDTPRRRELFELVRNQRIETASGYGLVQFRSRDEVLAEAGRFGDSPVAPFALTFWAGEYRRALPLWHDQCVRNERQGRVAAAVEGWAQTARCYNALGDFAAAQTAYQKGRTAGARLTAASTQVLQLLTARDEMWLALDENWEKAIAPYESGAEKGVEVTWFLAAFQAARARIYADLGREQPALEQLNMVIAPLERAPGWAPNYTRTTCDAAATLWMLGRTDHIEAIERNLREKTIASDFRYPMQDARLSLARLCALQGRYEEAVEWFAKARAVLEEQSARPLRATADFDEAWMYIRRGKIDDRERARPLLATAIEQFRDIGMTGWLRRAEKLSGESVDPP
jgi:hypothetical protein